MLCKQGEVQYFIGVQLDGSEHVEPLHNCIPEVTAKESAKLVCNPFHSSNLFKKSVGIDQKASFLSFQLHNHLYIDYRINACVSSLQHV